MAKTVERAGRNRTLILEDNERSILPEYTSVFIPQLNKSQKQEFLSFNNI